MKVAIRFLTAHLSQKLPAIYIDINGRNNYKYIINTPAHTQRFLKQNGNDPHPHHVFLFTTTETDTISGLTSMMFNKPPPFHGSLSKIYGDAQLLKYLDELKYKLGYNVANFSYCSWQGESRLGISSAEAIKKMEYDSNYIQIFQKLQENIVKRVDKKLQNDALEFYESRKQIYEDGFLQIQRFPIQYSSTKISNFIFRVKKNPVLDTEPIDKSSAKTFSENFMVLHYKQTLQFSLIAENGIFSKQIKQSPPSLVLHLVQNNSIQQSPQFQAFIKLFPNQTQHIFLNNFLQSNASSFPHYYHLHLVSQLSQFYPHFFPNLLTNLSNYSMSTKPLFLQQTFKYLNYHFYRANQEYVLQPSSKRGFNQLTSSNTSNLNLIQDHKHDYIQKIPSRDSVSKMVKVCDPKVIFLGTAASHPNNYRNISSILIDIQDTIVMLDCGQGSFAQFCNHFASKLNENLLKTRIIFITHCHSDHVLGIMQLISRRNRLLSPQNNSKLYLIIPANMIPWFHSYCTQIQDISVGCQVVFVQGLLDLKTNACRNGQVNDISQQKVRIINSKQKCNTNRMYKYDHKKKEMQLVDPFVIEYDHHKKEWLEIIESYRKQQIQTLFAFRNYINNIKIKQFEAIPVLHCPQSYAVILQHQSGIKISYSGDTRPIASFAKAANYSTLLIHQATFKDADINLAYEYFHSTVSEAIQIGMKSKSWMTALTHFSQSSFRDSEIIELQGDGNWKKKQYAKSNVFLCCDHLQTKISQLDHLPQITKKISREITHLSSRNR